MINPPIMYSLSKLSGCFTVEQITQEVENCFPFETFFGGQKEAIVQTVDAFINKGYRHVILEAPTGVGKTVIAQTIHRVIERLLSGERWRTTVTTTTKGLQQQYERDTKAYDLKGKTNYTCPYGNEHYGTLGCKQYCANKMCRPKMECPYVLTRNTWTNASNWRITNSAMLIKMCPSLACMPDKRANMMVFDECHKMPETLLSHSEILMDHNLLDIINTFNGGISPVYRIAEEVSLNLYTSFHNSLGKLVKFPEELMEKVSEAKEGLMAFLEFIEIKAREVTDSVVQEKCFRIIENCQRWQACADILGSGVRDFIVQNVDNDKRLILFKPVAPADVVQYSLYRKADYFLHMSATICGLDAYAKIMHLEEGEYITISMPHPIPLPQRKIYFAPVARMTGNTDTEDKLGPMVRGISQIAELHPNQNGLIHTASYKLAEALMMRSPLRNRMLIGRDRRTTMEALALSARHGQGIIVLSPSMVEGYDLKGDLCNWQVIAKVPYGFLGDPLIKYMADKYKGSYLRDAVLSVVQASGRVVRGVDDNGTTYILDEAFDTLITKGAQYIPQWYLEAIEGV